MVFEFVFLTDTDDAQALVSKNLEQLTICRYGPMSFRLTRVSANVVSALNVMLIVDLLLSNVW